MQVEHFYSSGHTHLNSCLSTALTNLSLALEMGRIVIFESLCFFYSHSLKEQIFKAFNFAATSTCLRSAINLISQNNF